MRPFVTDMAADARHALRQMRRRPAFTAIVVAALGLGIGASVALFTVVNSLVFRSLPYGDESRVRVFWSDYSWTDEEYDFLRQRLRVFEKLAVFSTEGATYTSSAASSDAATVLQIVVSSPTLFDVLGVRPILGRTYDANDDRPNAAPVVVISYGMWQQDLAGDPKVIGRKLLLDGKASTVIGVMPRGFFFPNPTLRAWRPLRLDPTQKEYTNGYLVVVGRTPSRTTDAQVNGEMQRLAGMLGERFTYPAAWSHARNASAVPVHAYVLGKVREPLLLLLSAVALLFLIACANAAALVLARTTDRAGELAVRTALGASAWRLVRHVLVESLLLALVAGAAGTGLAIAAFRLLVSRLPLSGGLDAVAAVGGATFVVAFALALVIATLVSIVPVRQLLRGTLGTLVSRERGEAGLSRGTRRTHEAIIAAQVTFAVLLVVGAVLLIRSVERIRDVDPGFDPSGVTAYTVFIGSGIEPASRAQLYRDLVQRIGALPGVSAAGLTNRLPVRDLGYQTAMSVEGRPELDGDKKPTALYRTATPVYFKAMGMQVIAGRGIDSTDVQDSPPVAVVSQSLANAMWPGEPALGKHITEAWSGTRVSRTVVGVMRDARLGGLMVKPPYALWVPFAQSGSGQVAAVVAVRSRLSAAAMMPAVRRAIAETDSRIAIARSQTMTDAVDASLAAPLQLRFFFSLFAALALTLGAIGVFGVVSYAVSRRHGEFAIRIALGASPRAVTAEVLRFGLAPVVIGVGAGTFAAAEGARWSAAFLFGIAANDATSFFTAAVAICGAGVAAALIPAMRARRISPAEALRTG